MDGIPEHARGDHLVQDLSSSFMTLDARGRLTPKTPEAAYMAANTYMMATKPTADDPRYSAYQTAMAGMGMMGRVVTDKGSASRPERSPHHQNSPRHGGEPAARRSDRRGIHTTIFQ